MICGDAVILRRLEEVEHWIFDLDGTLTVAVHDFELIRQQLDIPSGRPILEHLDGLPPAQARKKRALLDAIEVELCTATQAAPGAAELLAELGRRGARLGIVTRNTRANALRTLAHIGLGGFFEEPFIIGRGEAPHKPDPEGIRGLIEAWGVEPRETVMVGDYLFDLEAGRRAGSITVHVQAEGDFAWPDLSDLGVASLVDLVDQPRGG